MVSATGRADAGGPDQVAQATIRACANNQPLGVAFLHERKSDEGVKEVDVTIHVRERNTVLTEGRHGVHIHEVGTCAPCAAAGGHFDPGPAGNSSPDGNHPFHLGDLINIEIAKSGRGFLRTTTSRVTLSPGPLSVFDANGSAFIIHTGVDTYCPNGEVAGCAGGARTACGIIEPVR
jgi:Cu-Zn family superoxide dismutase